MEKKPQSNDYVRVNNPQSDHHDKFGWVEWVDTSHHAVAPYGVKFKDDSGASNFRADELQVIGTFERENRPEMLVEEDFDPQATAIALVWTMFYSSANIMGRDKQLLDDVKDVYVVWFCKTLQNWKAMVSTNYKDDCYYEVTHNGDKNETYIDRYVKQINVKVDNNTGELTAIKNDNFDFGF